MMADRLYDGLHQAKVDIYAPALADILNWFRAFGIKIVGADASETFNTLACIVEGECIPLDAEKVMVRISKTGIGIEFEVVKVY